MARKNEFIKTKYSNIFSLQKANGKNDYYANFMVDGVSYQKKNLTKLFDATTAKQAHDELEGIKADLRKGNDPFTTTGGDTVRDIVLVNIAKKKPKNPNKDNSRYKRSLELFYNNYIHAVIGHLKLSKVRREHAEKILESLDGNSKSFKLYLNVLMLDMFEKEFRAGKIKSNPFYELDYGKHTKKPAFDIRLNEPMEITAQKIYKSALMYRASHRLVFIISIMCVRRIGEIFQLKNSHINRYSNGEWYVIATEDITKTGIEEKYPLPKEAIELLPDNVLDPELEGEPLFTFSNATMFTHYNKLIAQADVKLNKGYKITSHDHRNLFLSILASSGVDTDLADRCLSHENHKTMKQVYLDVPYKKRKEVFQTWWEFLRN